MLRNIFVSTGGVFLMMVTIKPFSLVESLPQPLELSLIVEQTLDVQVSKRGKSFESRMVCDETS
jgi:hypothetical protein